MKTPEVISQSRSGSPSDPEGEKLSNMLAIAPGKKVRQRSLIAPRGHQSPAASDSGTEIVRSLEASINNSGDNEKDRMVIDERGIVRATGKILIDPKLLAEDPDAHRKRECGGRETCSACRFFAVAYQAQREAATAANVLARTYWRMDSDALDVLVAELGHTPYGKEEMKRWPRPVIKSNGYHIVRAAAPSLSGGVCAAISKLVTDKWMQTRFDALIRQIRAPAHYKTTMPLPVRAQEMGGVTSTGDGRYFVRLSISPGDPARKGKEFTIPIEARDQYQRRTLDLLSASDGAVKIGAAQLIEHRTKRGKWLLSISYTRVVPRSTGIAEAAINRGLVCFLAAVTTTGNTWLYSGTDIEAHLRGIKARRRARQGAINGRSLGHGRTRALRSIEALEAAGERWRATKCQTIARRFVDWLVGLGSEKLPSTRIGVLYLEDLAGIRDADSETLEGGKPIWDRIQEWPYYQLGARIKACAEEHGIEVRELPAFYISRRCPKCGYVDRERQGAAPRTYRCSQCKFARHIDIVAGLNLLGQARGEWDPSKVLANGNGKPRKTKGSTSRPRNG